MQGCEKQFCWGWEGIRDAGAVTQGCGRDGEKQLCSGWEGIRDARMVRSSFARVGRGSVLTQLLHEVERCHHPGRFPQHVGGTNSPQHAI